MKLNDTWGQRNDPESFQTKKNIGRIKRIRRSNKYKNNKRLFAGMQLFKTFSFHVHSQKAIRISLHQHRWVSQEQGRYKIYLNTDMRSEAASQDNGPRVMAGQGT